MPFAPATGLIPRLTVAILAAVLAGCGFQLRGAPPVSSALQPLAVDCAGNVPTQLCLAVTEQLELGGLELSNPEQASYLLKLRDFRHDRRASAITVRAAAAEYTLRQQVQMEVITDDRIPLVAETTLTSSETYRYDETNVLAKQREEQALQEQLYQRLAQQIIFRLAPLTEARIASLREQAEQAGDTDSSDAP